MIIQLGCTAESSNSIASNVGQVVAVKISWQDAADFNPFSVEELYYEIWHNDDFLTSHDYTSIVLLIKNYPQLVSGCIQIRAVVSDQRSELTNKTCYEGT